MPLANLFPSLPLPILDIVMYVVAVSGALLLTYGVFLEAERRQDAVFIIASGCLLVYALWIHSTIFAIAMSGLFIGSWIELIEILRGKHHHICTVEGNKK